jgi:hypothetical protein
MSNDKVDISRSPGRHTFQKEGYVKRMEEKGEAVDEHYLDYFQRVLEEHDHKFDDPKSRENNMEYDLLTTDWILEKVRNQDYYAQNLYAAMCNNDFQKLDVMPILTNKTWSCSWRYAGGIIADMQQKGDYIDWYCSGIRDTGYVADDDQFQQMTTEQREHYIETKKYVGESVVTDEIREDLKRLGWIVVDNDGNDLF